MDTRTFSLVEDMNNQGNTLLPIDILCYMISLLSIEDMLIMRQTCKIIRKNLLKLNHLSLEQTKTWIRDHQQLEGKFSILTKIMPDLESIHTHVELNASKIKHISKYANRNKILALAREGYIDKYFGFLSEIKMRVICTMDFIPNEMKLDTWKTISKLFLHENGPENFELRKLKFFVSPAKSIEEFSDAASVFTGCKIKGNVLTVPAPSFLCNTDLRKFEGVEIIKIKKTPLYHFSGCCHFKKVQGRGFHQCQIANYPYSYFCRDHLNSQIPADRYLAVTVKTDIIPEGISLTTSKNAVINYV